MDNINIERPDDDSETSQETLNLHAGDKIKIVVTEQDEVMIRPISKKVDDVFRKLHRPGKAAVSVEFINDAVKKRIKPFR